MTKLAILSTAKHSSTAWNIPRGNLQVHHVHRRESITNVQFPSNFLSVSPKLCKFL